MLLSFCRLPGNQAGRTDSGILTAIIARVCGRESIISKRHSPCVGSAPRLKHLRIVRKSGPKLYTGRNEKSRTLPTNESGRRPPEVGQASRLPIAIYRALDTDRRAERRAVMRTSRLKPEREGSVSAFSRRFRDPRRRPIGRRTKEAVRPGSDIIVAIRRGRLADSDSRWTVPTHPTEPGFGPESKPRFPPQSRRRGWRFPLRSGFPRRRSRS